MTSVKLKEILSVKFLAVILCGIVFSLSCGAMWVSGSFNLDCFYDIGRVHDVGYWLCITADGGMVYSGENRKMIITEETAAKTVILEGDMRHWKTLVLVLDDMNRDNMEWKLEFYDNAGTLTGSQQAVLTQGENVIELDGTEFAQMKIWIYQSAGATFSIQKMQFLESAEVMGKGQLLSAAAVFFLIYVVAVWAVRHICHANGRKINFYVLLSKLQDIYLGIGNQMPDMGKYPSQYLSIGRRLLFLGMLYYMLVINNKDTFFKSAYFPRHVLVWGLFLVGIACLSKDGELKKLDWNNSYLASWSALWIMVCISDFIVKKRFCGWGWLMLFGAGFLFFIWGNMEDPRELFRDMVKSIEYFSLFNLLFCFLARPRLEGYSYCGIGWNPNIYAQYLMPMCAVFLAELLEWIEKGKKGKGWIYDLIMVIASCYMGWISQSRTGLAALAVVILLFAGTLLAILGRKECKKRFWKAVIACTILILPVSFLCGWCIQVIPRKLGTQVIFPRDDYKIEVDMPSLALNVKAAGTIQDLARLMPVLAGEAEAPGVLQNLLGSRVVQKILAFRDIENFTSGRNLYWNAYLRNMNLWGHSYQLEIWGTGRGEHSGFIIIPYRYGVFAIVPYLIYIGFTIRYAWRYLRNRWEGQIYRFYPVGIAMGMLMILLVENVERPFYSVSCLAFYLLPGVFWIMGKQLPEQTGEKQDKICRKKIEMLPDMEN